jgi:hypothetical protein
LYTSISQEVDIMCKRQLKYYRQLSDEKSTPTVAQHCFCFWSFVSHSVAPPALLG